MKPSYLRLRAPSSWILLTASVILILNLLDGVLTLGVIHAGAATEANPLMDVSMESWGAVGFMLVKTSLVSLGVLLLFRLREHSFAARSLSAMALVYVVLLGYHVNSVDAIAHYLRQAPPL